MATTTRSLVAWYYSPVTGKWVKWREQSGAWAPGTAWQKATELARWLPSGNTFVDQWSRAPGGAWKHETRYRFGDTGALPQSEQTLRDYKDASDNWALIGAVIVGAFLWDATR